LPGAADVDLREDRVVDLGFAARRETAGRRPDVVRSHDLEGSDVEDV
jgi:hypothetical protein